MDQENFALKNGERLSAFRGKYLVVNMSFYHQTIFPEHPFDYSLWYKDKCFLQSAHMFQPTGLAAIPISGSSIGKVITCRRGDINIWDRINTISLSIVFNIDSYFRL